MRKTILNLEQTREMTVDCIKFLLNSLEITESVFFPSSKHDETIKKIARSYPKHTNKMMITRVVKDSGIRWLGICRRY